MLGFIVDITKNIIHFVQMHPNDRKTDFSVNQEFNPMFFFPLFALQDPKFGIKFNLKRLLKGGYQNLEETLPVREVFGLNPARGRVSSEGEETGKQQARKGLGDNPLISPASDTCRIQNSEQL